MKKSITNMLVLHRVDKADVRELHGPGSDGYASVQVPMPSLGNGVTAQLLVHGSQLSPSLTNDGQAVNDRLDLSLDADRLIVASYMDGTGTVQQAKFDPRAVASDWAYCSQFGECAYLTGVSEADMGFDKGGRVTVDLPDTSAAVAEGGLVGRGRLTVDPGRVMQERNGLYAVYLGGNGEDVPGYSVYAGEPDPVTGSYYRPVQKTTDGLMVTYAAGLVAESEARVEARERDLEMNKVVLPGVDAAHVHLRDQPGARYNYVMVSIGDRSVDGYGRVSVGPDAIVPSVDEAGEVVPGRYDVTLNGRMDGKRGDLVSYTDPSGSSNMELMDSAGLLERWEAERARQAELGRNGPENVMRNVLESSLSRQDGMVEVTGYVLEDMVPVRFVGVLPEENVVKGVEPHTADVGFPAGRFPVQLAKGEGYVPGEVDSAMLVRDWNTMTAEAEAARGKRAWLSLIHI